MAPKSWHSPSRSANNRVTFSRVKGRLLKKIHQEIWRSSHHQSPFEHRYVIEKSANREGGPGDFENPKWLCCDLWPSRRDGQPQWARTLGRSDTQSAPGRDEAALASSNQQFGPNHQSKHRRTAKSITAGGRHGPRGSRFVEAVSMEPSPFA
jgi:hypothetical protein